MSKKKEENVSFICENCGKEILPLTNGSFRNHCPFCLHSLHVDCFPGDRQNECKGIMKPIKIEYNTKKGYQIVHKCLKCGNLQKNKIAENTIQEDNKELINKIMKDSF